MTYTGAQGAQGAGALRAAGRAWRTLVTDFRPGRPIPGLPRLVQQAVAWALAAADLVLLAQGDSAAATGFFVIFPLLWVVTRTRPGGVLATVAFSVGIAVVDTARSDLLSGLANAGLSMLFSLTMGLWMWRVYAAKHEVAQALAAKEEALGALAQTQAELAATEHAAGVAAERARWAHDVHDTLAQGFVSVITLTQAVRAEVGRAEADEHPVDPTAVLDHLARVEQVARDNLAEARALVAGDGPAALAGADLAEALERLAAEQVTHGGVHPVLTLSVPEGLPPALEVVVLRTVQEALSNVRRHARATQTAVDVHAEESVGGGGRELVVSVLDDGTGTGGAPEGTGLSGMRARVEAAGGTLTVDPVHPPDGDGGTGTVVEARMPL